MKLVPQSSFWRTVLMIWAVILATQIVTVAFAYYYLFLPGVQQTAHVVMLEIDTIEASSKIAGRDAILQALSKHQNIHFTDDESEVAIADNVEFASRFFAPMREILGPETELRVGSSPQPGLWITHPKLKGIWIHYPLQNWGRYEGIIVTIWSVGTPLFAFLIAALFVRQLNRPLKRLATAATRIGRGEPVSNLSLESGPAEIVAVNQAFNQMRKSLQQATRERALLLAGISHDLRTPLTRMRLTAELLGATDPELTEGMVRDIEDMDAILDQFIAFIRDGNDEDTEVGDLNEVIQEVVSQFEADGVNIACQLNDLPEISLKRLSLKRMFMNLIGNAIRHGGGKVDLESGLKDGEILVTVADRGPGLSEEEMHALFQPFARGDESRGTKGSGLGLAIVKRIVDMHHGRVELKNREGGGLMALVYFPVTGQLVPPDSMLSGIR